MSFVRSQSNYSTKNPGIYTPPPFPLSAATLPSQFLNFKFKKSAMAMLYLGFYSLLLVMIKLSSSSSEFPPNISTTANEACVDGAASFLLTFGLYQNSCPEAEPIIFAWVEKAVSDDPRMAASLLRLHFHDCFVNGCDASVLLDDTPNFVGEKTAAPNLNSLRGFEVIDAIKNDLEFFCPGTVSCADILAIAARDSVVLSGGLGWEVQVGRKDSLSASKAAANNNIPGPTSGVPTLVAKFQNVGLSLEDMVTLSGAHTLGKARCATFSSRLNGNSNGNEAPNINLEFIQSLQQLCANANATLADLDVKTPSSFDNQYYMNLLSGEGLLPSDQVLVSGDGRTRQLVESYVDDQTTFLEEFKNAMLKMGSILPAEENGEIRRNCRVTNQLT